ncbi:hypothetical protein [Pulveribacter sp.]|uniref:hypothetical protein n=1 Tax=Pulveribacter sp. TaxID=2678893 RepID=UPI00289EF2AB|nr:hypothetical protein [Pulveribacter sp.]
MTASDPPEPSAAGALARLQAAHTDAQRLTAAQQKFNRLLERVNGLERLLEGLQQQADQLRAPHLQRMDALQRRVAQAQQAMAFFLHERLQQDQDGLAPALQRTARECLRGLLRAARSPVDAARAAHWQQLQRQHLPPQPEPGLERGEIEALLQHFEGLTGQRPELPDLAGIRTAEQLLAALLRQDQQRRQAAAERRAERRARRKPTARQAQEQAQAQDARAAQRAIYRQLASALHPDREGDPAERERKQALMSQANTAHERGDLLALLRLQLAAEQVDGAAIARLGDERLASLSLLLQRQVGMLDKALAQAEARLAHELGAPVSARQPPEVLAAQLQTRQQQLQDAAETLEGDLQRVQDEAGLRRWLRGQAQAPKGPPGAAGRPTGLFE